MAARFAAPVLFGFLVTVSGAFAPAQNRIETGNVSSAGAKTTAKAGQPEGTVAGSGQANERPNAAATEPAPMRIATNWGGRTIVIRSSASFPRKPVASRPSATPPKSSPEAAVPGSGTASRSNKIQKDPPASVNKERNAPGNPANRKGKGMLDSRRNLGPASPEGHVNRWDPRAWNPQYGRAGRRCTRWNRSLRLRSRPLADNRKHVNIWDIR